MRSNVPSETLTTFREQLRTLLNLARIPRIEDLAAIFVVPDGEMVTTVNALLSADDGTASYQAGDWQPSGMAVPVEVEGQLRGCIVLENRVLAPIIPGLLLLPTDTVSTVLEELMHVRVYSALWPTLSDNQNTFDRRDSLSSICMSAQGEYLVNRWKSELLATVPLATVEGGFSVILLGSPEPLGPVLDRGGEELVNAVVDAGAGFITPDEGWRRVFQIIYRQILDPLVRESARREGRLANPELADEFPQVAGPSASESRFFARHVSDFWDEFHNELTSSHRTFDADPAESVRSLVKMRGMLVNFLKLMGITYEPKPGGSAYVYFDGAVALTRKSEWTA